MISLLVNHGVEPVDTHEDHSESLLVTIIVTLRIWHKVDPKAALKIKAAELIS